MLFDLTGFQRDLLTVIAGLDEPHGLAIEDELEEYDETEVHHGRRYPNLDTLVDTGLVEKDALHRRTNVYTLTQRGRSETEARRDWEQQSLDDLVATCTVADRRSYSLARAVDLCSRRIEPAQLVCAH